MCLRPWQALEVLTPGKDYALATDHERYRWCFRSEIATMLAGSVLDIAVLTSLTRLKFSGYSVRCGHEHQTALDKLLRQPPTCRCVARCYLLRVDGPACMACTYVYSIYQLCNLAKLQKNFGKSSGRMCYKVSRCPGPKGGYEHPNVARIETWSYPLWCQQLPRWAVLAWRRKNPF